MQINKTITNGKDSRKLESQSLGVRRINHIHTVSAIDSKHAGKMTKFNYM
jgi:hypothetical protein